MSSKISRNTEIINRLCRDISFCYKNHRDGVPGNYSEEANKKLTLLEAFTDELDEMHREYINRAKQILLLSPTSCRFDSAT